MAKIKQITIKDLYLALSKEIKKGNGNKYLVAADDNEGNGYHGVFFCVSEFDESMADLVSDSQVTDPDKLMILG